MELWILGGWYNLDLIIQCMLKVYKYGYKNGGMLEAYNLGTCLCLSQART